MSKEPGPKERALREQREANYAARNVKRPSASELRQSIGKIKAIRKNPSNRKGR